MKKMLILLLVMLLALLCLVPAALVEEGVPVEVRMGLSQTQFAEPGEVTVDITITNVSGEDMPGPLALYAPDGRIIEEFGTPTLLADETRTWQGTWNVTKEQLDAGKLTFAVRYTCQAEDGSLTLKNQTYYGLISWEKKPPQTSEIVLKGNPTTGYSWDWQGISGNSCINVSCETTQVNDDPELVGGPVRYTYVVEGTQPGYVEICFTYARPWESDPAMAVYHLYYDICVDEELNVTIVNSRFEW